MCRRAVRLSWQCDVWLVRLWWAALRCCDAVWRVAAGARVLCRLLAVSHQVLHDPSRASGAGRRVGSLVGSDGRAGTSMVKISLECWCLSELCRRFVGSVVAVFEGRNRVSVSPARVCDRGVGKGAGTSLGLGRRLANAPGEFHCVGGYYSVPWAQRLPD